MPLKRENYKENQFRFLQHFSILLNANYGYGNFFCGLGPFFDLVGLNFLHWAGQEGSICDKNSIHQFVEKPYLADEEYPELLTDLSGWIMKKYLPRNFKLLEPMAGLSFNGMFGYGAFPAMMQFLNPAISEMFTKLGEAARLAGRFYAESAAFDNEMIEAGYPLFFNATTSCAFDMLSDCLRGTIDTMADLYEQPENVHAAIEHFYPGSLYGALGQAAHCGSTFLCVRKGIFLPFIKNINRLIQFMKDENHSIKTNVSVVRTNQKKD